MYNQEKVQGLPFITPDNRTTRYGTAGISVPAGKNTVNTFPDHELPEK